jgi:hypothetical protein
MRLGASFFVACTLVAACSAFEAAGDGTASADAGAPSEAGAATTPFVCPPDSLYCLDFDGPPRGTYASVELASQTAIASGAVLAAPTPGARGNAARFVLPASTKDDVEFAAKTFKLPVTDDVQIEADILVDDPHMSLAGNSLTLFAVGADALSDTRTEAKIDGNTDATVRINLYAHDPSGSAGSPTNDDKTKQGIPFGSWVHLTLQARLAGTNIDAGTNALFTDRGAHLTRAMKRNANATKTTFIFGIGKSVPTPVDITVTFDNVTVTKLP